MDRRSRDKTEEVRKVGKVRYFRGVDGTKRRGEEQDEGSQSFFGVVGVGGCGFEKPSKAKPGKVGSEGRQ